MSSKGTRYKEEQIIRILGGSGKRHDGSRSVPPVRCIGADGVPLAQQV